MATSAKYFFVLFQFLALAFLFKEHHLVVSTKHAPQPAVNFCYLGGEGVYSSLLAAKFSSHTDFFFLIGGT